MAVLSDFGRAVVLENVLGYLITLRAAGGLGLLGLCLRILAGDNGRGGSATCTGNQQEITAGQSGCWGFHHDLLYEASALYSLCEKSARYARENQHY
jgi:hypothetical protein